jgi:hypothetical protein
VYLDVPLSFFFAKRHWTAPGWLHIPEHTHPILAIKN